MHYGHDSFQRRMIVIQKTINIADTKKHFSDLLGWVAYGKEQIIFSWRKGSKDSRVCFLKTLSALLMFFRFLPYLFLCKAS